jgi:hypothetical protein
MAVRRNSSIARLCTYVKCRGSEEDVFSRKVPRAPKAANDGVCVLFEKVTILGGTLLALNWLRVLQMLLTACSI